MKKLYIGGNIILIAVCFFLAMELIGQQGKTSTGLTDQSAAAAPVAPRWTVRAQAGQDQWFVRSDTGNVMTLDELEHLSAGSPGAAQSQGTNIRVNQTGPAAEISLVINPANPDNIIAAAMDSNSLAVRATPYVSFDAAQTWTQMRAASNLVPRPTERPECYRIRAIRS